MRMLNVIPNLFRNLKTKMIMTEGKYYFVYILGLTFLSPN